jgi:hypothetical protein
VGPGADPESARILGRVVDLEGGPVADATVRVGVSGTGGKEVDIEFETDSAAAFELCGLPPRELFISASKNDEATGRQRHVYQYIDLKPATAHEVALVLPPPPPLPPGGRIAIAMTFPDAGTARNSRHRHIRGYVFDEQGDCLKLNQDGEYDDREDVLKIFLSRPPPGFYKVLVMGSGYTGRINGCQVADGVTSEYRLALERVRDITGRVVDAGSGVGVRGFFAGTIGEKGLTAITEREATSEDGTFTCRLFAVREPGRIHVSASGYKPREIEVSAFDTALGDIGLEPAE